MNRKHSFKSRYKITKIVRAFRLVRTLWFIVPSARDSHAFHVFSQHPKSGVDHKAKIKQPQISN